MLKEMRWRQRFENYEKAFQCLERVTRIPQLSEAERGGLIQFFETAFELAWKMLKDYLETQGFVTKSPREAIKQAFQIELLQNGEQWLEALEDRNLIAHTYDEATCKKLERLIKEKYFTLLQELYGTFKTKT